MEPEATHESERTHDAGDYRRAIYENYASNFQDTSGTFDAAAAERWSIPYQHYLRGWLPDDKDSNILEVACGGGRMLHFLCERGYSAIEGVDLSPEQVALASQVVPNVHRADVLTFLEQRKEKYDRIIGLDIVEHFFKHEVLRFIELCFEALKPGGRLILQTPNADSPWGTVHRYNDFTHEVGFNPNALGRLLALRGFVDIESREVGPVPYGHTLKSSLRWVIWKAIRFGLQGWNLAETGAVGSGVFTRVFLISAVKQAGTHNNSSGND